MMKNKKNIINFLILIGITVLVLYFALKDDFQNIMNQLRSINVVWLLVAFLIVIIYWLLRSKAINIFTRKFMPKTKYRSFFQ